MLNKLLIKGDVHSEKLLGFFEINSEDKIYIRAVQLFCFVCLFFVTELPLNDIMVPLIFVPGILFRKLAFSKIYIGFITAILVWYYMINGLNDRIPNHKYLYSITSIALFMVLLLRSRNDANWFKVLTFNSKIIIGICFLFATFGKFMAPEFMNGTFFEVKNVLDSRLVGFTSVVTPYSSEQLNIINEEFREMMHTSNPQNHYVEIPPNSIHKSISLFLSYWTVLIEGSIAIAFLLPIAYKISRYRDWLLLTFIITTYPIATVSGFAIILSLLAFIQSFNNSSSGRIFSIIYLLIFLFIPFFQIPYLAVFDRLF